MRERRHQRRRRRSNRTERTTRLARSLARRYDFVFDVATSVVANGTVRALAREGKRVPAGAIVDADGAPTTDPAAFAAHNCFGGQ